MSESEYHEAINKPCAICGASVPRGTAKPGAGMHIDHDHKTGKVRDTLCAHCNRGLGEFREDVGVMRKAIRYLLVHGK